MQTLRRFAFITAFTIALAAVSSDAHASDPVFACCEPDMDPLGCMEFDDPHDMTWCDPGLIVGLCWLDEETSYPEKCWGVPTLMCCDSYSDAVWIDVCEPHGPTMYCDGTIVASNL
jgi:hypothetical protein